MSQFEGTPPGSFPPGAYPPGQFPPGQFPPSYPGQMFGQQPSRTSGMAITSLVLGILGCVPFITSLGAILFGIFGIVTTGKPGIRGRWLAVVGLILGILGVLFWGGGTYRFTRAMARGTPDKAIAQSFVTDLTTGNLPAAQALCAPGTSSAALQQAQTQLKGYGTMASFTPIIAVGFTDPDGSDAGVVVGAAAFGANNRSIIIKFKSPPNAPPLIESWQIK